MYPEDAKAFSFFMAYPSSIDNFTDPSGTSLITSPDHAGLHTSVNDAINIIETTLGTTSATAALKNITVGKFALAGSADTFQKGTINTSAFNSGTIGTALLIGGTVGTALVQGGTANNVVMGSPAITGGTITSSLRILGSALYTGTAGNTVTLNLASANRHLINMPNSAGGVTFAVSNVTVNQPFIVEVMQGTAGLGTPTWFSTIRWAGSSVPTPTTTASRKDTFGFIATGAATFDGYIVGQNV